MNLFITLIRIAFLLIGFYLFWEKQSTKPQASKILHLPLSIIIPVRNEALRLSPLLSSLKPYINRCEIIFMNDHSVDDSVKLIQDAGFQVFDCPPLPKHWQGKPHALHLGVQKSSQENLLFLDADTWIEPLGIEKLWTLFIHDQNRPLSSYPYHQTQTFQESFTTFFDLTMIMLSGQFAPLSNRKGSHLFFGMVQLISKQDYVDSGGYASVKSTVLEDVAFGNKLQKINRNPRVILGKNMVSFRMYQHGVLDIWQGWSKNIGKGLVAVNPLAILFTGFWLFGVIGATLVQPILFLLGAYPLWVAAFYGLFAIQFFILYPRIGKVHWWYVFLFPFYALAKPLLNPPWLATRDESIPLRRGCKGRPGVSPFPNSARVGCEDSQPASAYQAVKLGTRCPAACRGESHFFYRLA